MKNKSKSMPKSMEWEYEVEGESDELQVDTVFVLNEQGKAVRLEVPDDADDYQA